MQKIGFMRLLFAVLVTTGSMTPALQAAEKIDSSVISKSVIADVRKWLARPVVFISIQAQNQKHSGLAQSEIISLDKQWRRERKESDQPLIAATLSNPLSSYLTQIQSASGGLFTEIFVMDQKGLNVGQSSVTSDYWQGDEGKFKKTFPISADAVFVDEAEFHKKSKTWRAQLNLTISKGGRGIGAATVEMNLTELARRLGQ